MSQATPVSRDGGFGASEARPLVRGGKVSHLLAQAIVDEIVRRDLRDGDRLPDTQDILRIFNVGRDSLREAFSILELIGLIELRPGTGGGAIVRTGTAEALGRILALSFHSRRSTIRELSESRLALEPLVAGLAALRQEPTGMEELRSAMEILESPDEKDYIGQSERFHLAVAQASGGTILEVLAQALKEVWTSRVDARMLRNRVRPKFIYREAHIAIGQAILDGDASKSETLMRDHLTRYFALVDKQYPQIWDETIHV